MQICRNLRSSRKCHYRKAKIQHKSTERRRTVSVFCSRSQNPGKYVRVWNLKDDLIRDKIVCGVASSYVRKQLLKERALTLDGSIEIDILNELSDRDNIELASKAASTKEEIHSIGKHGKGRKFFPKQAESKPDIQNCKNCGGEHAPIQKSCPASGRKRLPSLRKAQSFQESLSLQAFRKTFKHSTKLHCSATKSQASHQLSLS